MYMKKGQGMSRDNHMIYALSPIYAGYNRAPIKGLEKGYVIVQL